MRGVFDTETSAETKIQKTKGGHYAEGLPHMQGFQFAHRRIEEEGSESFEALSAPCRGLSKPD